MIRDLEAGAALRPTRAIRLSNGSMRMASEPPVAKGIDPKDVRARERPTIGSR